MTISQLTFRIEQKKILTEEALMLTQFFDSLVQDSEIDYERYASSLQSTYGFADVLYLTGKIWSGTMIYSSGECLDLEGAFENEGGKSLNLTDYSGCQLMLKQGNKPELSLLATNTDQYKIFIPSKVLFRIIPFDSDSNYIRSESQNITNDLGKQGVRVFLHLYSSFYQPIGVNNISQPLQLFFNFNVAR